MPADSASTSSNLRKRTSPRSADCEHFPAAELPQPSPAPAPAASSPVLSPQYYPQVPNFSLPLPEQQQRHYARPLPDPHSQAQQQRLSAQQLSPSPPQHPHTPLPGEQNPYSHIIPQRLSFLPPPPEIAFSEMNPGDPQAYNYQPRSRQPSREHSAVDMSPAIAPRSPQQNPHSYAIAQGAPAPLAYNAQQTPAAPQPIYVDPSQQPGLYDGQQQQQIIMNPEYAAAQQRQLRRHKTRRAVELKGGKLVLDIPVPEKVLSLARHRDAQEFTHMRYTAVTSDPNDFVKEGYTLRAAQYGRSTELFIVLTMYNEDETLFAKSMTSVMKNIAHLCSRRKSKTWGADGWKKVVVCVVSDGRSKINERVLNQLGVLGCYQDGLMKTKVNTKEVTGHLFEYTTQINVDVDKRIRGADAGFVPCQMLFLLKEKNQKKLNSHRWFLNAFGPVLNPNVCVLIDVGTKPTGTSLYHLWKAFDRDPSVGGACGEIQAELGTGCSKLINPLVAAQNFEYKTSNILDKPLESMFGFISVLPGAFSAYRYRALLDSSPGVGPLSSYFLGEKMHGKDADVFSANKYLAEDRILCFELVMKRKEAWRLKYVEAAKAETDVPSTVPEFISQRRRWLNGSFFASVHALQHFYYVFRTRHSMARILALLFQTGYNLVNIFFTWFALANFYLIFYFLGQQSKCQDLGNGKQDCSGDPFLINGEHYGYYVFMGLRYLYLISIIATFIASMGNRPQAFRVMYTLIIVLNAALMCMLMFMAGFTVYQAVPKTPDEWKDVKLLAQPGFRDIVVSVAATYGVYLVAAIIHMDPWHVFTSMIQYMLFLPSSVNVLQVYAFTNLHDVSWGTKGDNGGADLGGVVAKTGKDGALIAEIELLTEKQDINAEYDRMLVAMRAKDKGVKKAQGKTQDDYFRAFRTKVLLWWIFSNAAIIAVLTSDKLTEYFEKQKIGFNPYLTFIFWSVAGLSIIRFIGSIAFTINRMIWG